MPACHTFGLSARRAGYRAPIAVSVVLVAGRSSAGGRPMRYARPGRPPGGEQPRIHTLNESIARWSPTTTGCPALPHRSPIDRSIENVVHSHKATIPGSGEWERSTSSGTPRLVVDNPTAQAESAGTPSTIRVDG